MTDAPRLAVIGLGTIGSSHAGLVGSSTAMRLAAVCDADAARSRKAGEERGVPAYADAAVMMDRERPDGVIVATPHPGHLPVALEAFARGISVLCEKPQAVHAGEARRMNDTFAAARAKQPGLVFAIMFQNRASGLYAALKELLAAGALGRLVRTTWIVTDWFRTQAYYDNGGWRATWRGEGGGVLLNQCPHNLDLYQWLVGMPDRVTGFAALGKYHDIEVEDEVSAVFHHDGGMVGHFVTSTGESPGTNRLEIVGENGRMVVEGGQVRFDRNETSMLEFLKTTAEPFAQPASKPQEVAIAPGDGPGHLRVIANFAAAIRDPATPLIAHGTEGIRSLSLGNAIMLSSWLGNTVTLPLDEDLYAGMLAERVAASRFRKKSDGIGVVVNAAASFREVP